MISKRRSFSSATPNHTSDFFWKPLPTGEAVVHWFNDDKASEAVIPEELDGRPVVAVESVAFSHCKSLRSLTLPSSFRYFLSSASDIASLETNLRKRLFGPLFNCSSLLQLLVAPKNTPFRSVDGVILSADGKTLDFCSEEKDAYSVPNGAEKIAEKAFAERQALTSVAFPTSLRQIGPDAFFQCESLSQLVFSEGLKEIDVQAFLSCKTLKSVKFPSRLLSIKACAFFFCDILTQIKFGPGLQTLGSRAFEYCPKLTRISFPKNVDKTINKLFYACGVEELDLPNGLQNLGKRAFSENYNLKHILLPASLKTLGAETFAQAFRYRKSNFRKVLQQSTTPRFSIAEASSRLNFRPVCANSALALLRIAPSLNRSFFRRRSPKSIPTRSPKSTTV